ncbi:MULTISPECIES: hypothetical protein [Bacillus]|uniref:hypothetical protein n=1 Tax=Bacillus TaxID=1386 RepID=UPI0015E28FD1|nr:MULTISPECIES: hypothetical protein [Bacillus]MBA1162600.1 hypothetical protein [Bacillus licheniformis]MCY8587596.1 hypothetical protein [Bacillus haynesii]MCY8742513.1 hypothetical protein [Bacillus licheniformis]MEC1022798.1 hypothetical protein [Bacillus paralicheniformis]MEC1027045.1 hypothetical protein [Bacillus paralicheniformis]
MSAKKTTDDYVCKECNHRFTAPRRARHDYMNPCHPNECPNCKQAGIFNITAEEEVAKTDPYHPWF